MAIAIPFPLPNTGFARNSKVRINLDYIVAQFNSFNTGTATWDNVSIGTANNLTGTLTFYNASNAFYLTFQAGATSANITYTLPATNPSVNNAILRTQTSGVLSWSDYGFDVTSSDNGLLWISGGTTIDALTNSQGTNAILYGSAANTPKWVQFLPTSNQTTVAFNSNDITIGTVQDIGTSSNVQFGTVQVGGGSASNPSVKVIFSGASTNTGLWSPSGTELYATVAGVTQFAIDNTGLAVATTELRAPAVRGTTSLQVGGGGVGVITITSGASGAYALTLPTDDGSANQYLTTNGSGVLSWSTAAGTGTVNSGTANTLAYYASSTNAVSSLTAITASRALASDSNGLPVAATTTATELGYVNGVTSAIQTQINTKAPSANPTFTGVALFADGSAAAPSISFTNDSNSGIYSNADNQIGFSTAGSIRLNLISTQLRCVIDLVAAGATNNLGDATDYWNDVSYKTLTDRGCIPWCDDGVELLNGQHVSDLDAILEIKKHAYKKTGTGLPRLDYTTFPKHSFRKVEEQFPSWKIERDKDGEPWRILDDGQRVKAEDGVEMTMFFGVMIGAFKELNTKILELQTEIKKLKGD